MSYSTFQRLYNMHKKTIKETDVVRGRELNPYLLIDYLFLNNYKKYGMCPNIPYNTRLEAKENKGSSMETELMQHKDCIKYHKTLLDDKVKYDTDGYPVNVVFETHTLKQEEACLCYTTLYLICIIYMLLLSRTICGFQEKQKNYIGLQLTVSINGYLIINMYLWIVCKTICVSSVMQHQISTF